jgi:hypothetical protein
VRALRRRGPGGGPLDEFSRDACLDSARELLDLFRVARGAGNEDAYANKILDLYAFVAAAVLAVGVACSAPGRGACAPAEAEAEDDDWATVLRVTEILDDAAPRPFGRLAAHSCRALQRIVDFRWAGGAPGGGVRVMVPFAGVVTLTRVYPDGVEPTFEPWRVSSIGDVFERHLPAVQEVEPPTYHDFDLALSSYDLARKYFDPLFTAYPTANVLNDLDSGLAWVHDAVPAYF